MINKPEEIITGIKNLGVSAAAIFEIDEGAIRFDNIFRELCEQNTCGAYGKNYKCPPHVGSPGELKAEVLHYKTAVIIQTIHNIEDSFDFESMGEGGEIHNGNIKKTEKFIRENFDFEKILTLGAGGCSLCAKCGAADDTPCRFPDKAVGSIEAYCIDAAHLTNSHGLKYINGENTVSYVAVFLVK
jgi:predicted metal-binding protein